MLRLDQLMLYCLVIMGLIQLVASEHNTIMALQPKYSIRKRNIGNFAPRSYTARDYQNSVFGRDASTTTTAAGSESTGSGNADYSVSDKIGALQTILDGTSDESSTGSAAQSPDGLDDFSKMFVPFNDRCVNTTNKYRVENNLAPLTLNNTLIKAAQTWATHLAHMSTSDSINLSNSLIADNLGENLYGGRFEKGYKFSCDDAINSWYEQGKNVTHPITITDDVVENVGGYTQLMSNETTSVACGSAKLPSKNSLYIVVCEYYPAGNVIGTIVN